jgi:hypothetical protein
MYTASVGVPSTAYQRGATSSSRSGRCSEIACDEADCSRSGATTQTSSPWNASARAFRPAALTPSSFESRTRTRENLPPSPRAARRRAP